MAQESRILYTPRDTRQWNRRAESRRKKIVWLAGGGVVFVLLLAGVVFFARLPGLQVKEIQVRGLTTLDSEEVRGRARTLLSGAYAFVIPRGMILMVSGKGIERVLMNEFPRIKTVSVKKHLPDVLDILVEERTPWGIFCAADKQCAYLDETGFAYESAPSFSGRLVTKVSSDAGFPAVPSQAVEPARMETMRVIGEEVKKILNVSTVSYELISDFPKEIRVVGPEGYRVYFDRESDLQNAFRVLKTVLAEEIKDRRARLDYIDLRFGNKVFYKLQ